MQNSASARPGNKLCLSASGMLCSLRCVLQKVYKLCVSEKPGYLFLFFFPIVLSDCYLPNYFLIEGRTLAIKNPLLMASVECRKLSGFHLKLLY